MANSGDLLHLVPAKHKTSNTGAIDSFSGYLEKQRIYRTAHCKSTSLGDLGSLLVPAETKIDFNCVLLIGIFDFCSVLVTSLSRDPRTSWSQGEPEERSNRT